MDAKFLLDAAGYKAEIIALKNTSEKVDAYTYIEGMSACSNILIDEYLLRLSMIGELIKKYKELVQKDGGELISITEDIVRQETKWAGVISKPFSSFVQK